MDAKYRATCYESFFLGFDTYVVYKRGTETRFTFSSAIKRILDICHASDSLEGLANRASKLLNEEVSHVREVIRKLVDYNLIVPESSFFPKPGGSSQSVFPITSLCLPTGNRLPQLKEALLSYKKNFDDYARVPTIVVMDDSESDHLRAENRKIIQELGLFPHARYAGRPEKELYISELSREGVDPDVARFAVLGDFAGVTSKPGANRNCILLDTIGEYVLVVDDDTVCRLTCHPERDDRMYFSGQQDPRDGWYYEDRDHLVSEVPWCSGDIIGEHESLLGRGLTELVRRDADLVLDGDCGSILYGVLKGSGRVVATMSGIAGDSGMYSSTSILYSTGEKQRKLFEDESAFVRAFRSRDVLSLVRGRTVTEYPFCVAATLGLDNQDLLPPFLPLGRNEDGVFAALVRSTTPHFLGHIPIAVFHNATPGRKYERFPDFRVSDMVLCLMKHVYKGFLGNTELSLKSLGRGLIDIANLDAGDFWEVVSRAATRVRGIQMRTIESVMRRSQKCPLSWETEVKGFLQHSLLQLADPDCYVPEELKETRPNLAARNAVQEIIGLTGRLLCAWPDMVAIARHLRNREVRISVKLTDENRDDH